MEINLAIRRLWCFFTKTCEVSYVDFYITASLYNAILATEKEVSKKSICHFFSQSPYTIPKRHIQVFEQGNKLFYLCIKFYDQVKRKTFKEKIQKNTEIFPFWIAFPDNFCGAPRWQQGYEQQYSKVFLDYWKSLSSDQQKLYMESYNCPIEWQDWLREYTQKNL